MDKHFYPDPSEHLPALPEEVDVRVGSHEGKGCRIGIVAGRFNIQLTGELVRTAVETLTTHGVAPGDVTVAWVPGSFELPLALNRMAKRHELDALIACGVVVEGETLHGELILRSVTTCLADLSLTLDCPVIDAVVGARTVEQAEARCLSGKESRGAYAALAALESVTLFR